MSTQPRKHIQKTDRFSTFYATATADPKAFADATFRDRARVALARKKIDLAREAAALNDALFAGQARRSDRSHNNPFDQRLDRKKTQTLFASVMAAQERVRAVEIALTAK